MAWQPQPAGLLQLAQLLGELQTGANQAEVRVAPLHMSGPNKRPEA